MGDARHTNKHTLLGTPSRFRTDKSQEITGNGSRNVPLGTISLLVNYYDDDNDEDCRVLFEVPCLRRPTPGCSWFSSILYGLVVVALVAAAAVLFCPNSRLLLLPCPDVLCVYLYNGVVCVLDVVQQKHKLEGGG